MNSHRSADTAYFRAGSTSAVDHRESDRLRTARNRRCVENPLSFTKRQSENHSIVARCYVGQYEILDNPDIVPPAQNHVPREVLSTSLRIDKTGTRPRPISRAPRKRPSAHPFSGASANEILGFGQPQFHHRPLFHPNFEKATAGGGAVRGRCDPLSLNTTEGSLSARQKKGKKIMTLAGADEIARIPSCRCSAPARDRNVQGRKST